MNIKVVYDVQTAQPWVVRVVRTGESYGRDDRLTYLGGEPLVEFFDARYPHTNLGQFVSRYRASTMLGHSPSEGLDLYGGTPGWTVSSEVMAQVIAWLQAELADELADEMTQWLEA